MTEQPSPRQTLIGKRVAVLDQGWIELQDMMGDDLAIVNAARVSFLGESKGSERDKKLLFYLLEHRHTSPFEQVEFRFRVRAPLVVWWQWVRHRTWHVNAQSGRYTPFEEGDFYVPAAWRLQAADNKQASEGELTGPAADALTEALREHYERSYALYRQALDAGVARELARMFLPGFAVYYTWGGEGGRAQPDALPSTAYGPRCTIRNPPVRSGALRALLQTRPALDSRSLRDVRHAGVLMARLSTVRVWR